MTKFKNSISKGILIISSTHPCWYLLKVAWGLIGFIKVKALGFSKEIKIDESFHVVRFDINQRNKRLLYSVGF